MAALKEARGTMYFVVGVKLATDATIETCEEGKRSVAGNVEVNATQATGLGTRGTAGVELGQVLGGRNVQNEFKSTTTEEVKGERAFAMGYYCVQLRREVKIRQHTFIQLSRSSSLPLTSPYERRHSRSERNSYCSIILRTTCRLVWAHI